MRPRFPKLVVGGAALLIALFLLALELGIDDVSFYGRKLREETLDDVWRDVDSIAAVTRALRDALDVQQGYELPERNATLVGLDAPRWRAVARAARQARMPLVEGHAERVRVALRCHAADGVGCFNGRATRLAAAYSGVQPSTRVNAAPFQANLGSARESLEVLRVVYFRVLVSAFQSDPCGRETTHPLLREARDDESEAIACAAYWLTLDPLTLGSAPLRW